MIYITNGVLCLALLFAIYQTMIFVVDLGNAMIEGILDKDETPTLDNRHLLLSWLLVVVSLFVNQVRL